MEPFRYDKPGATIAIYPDRLEMTTGFLWARKTHVVPLRAVTGVSVAGVGGSRLLVETAGRAYELAVGVGAAGKIRLKIVEALPR
jgi:hypothetical protein